jgi:hypothetical protein
MSDLRILTAATVASVLIVGVVAASATGVTILLSPRESPELTVVPAKQAVMFMEGNPKRVLAVFPQENGMETCEVLKMCASVVAKQETGLRCEIREMDVVVETNKM